MAALFSGENWVRYAVREMAVWLMVHFDEFKRQVLFKFVDNQAGTAITGVADNGQRAERTSIDVPQKVIDVGAHHFQGLVPALFCSISKRFQHPISDLIQPIIGTDGPGFGADHFHAVVIFRVVAGGHHDTAVHLVVAGGEIHLFGAAQTDIEHIRPRGHQAGAERFGNVRA